MQKDAAEESLALIDHFLSRCCFVYHHHQGIMADDLTELEARLFEWIRQSDFDTMPWSTASAAKAFKVKKDEIYEAVAALTRKVPERIQVFYKEGSVHIAAE